MRRIMILLTIVATLAMSATPPFAATKAQTRNQSSKVQLTEAFVFPNECTNELMDVTDTTTIICHDQQRADGTVSEKCEIRQDVNATGQITGINWHGTATFKDDFVTADGCNFSFSNRGKVHLISDGAAVNTVITFDDFVRMQDCLMTADQHLVSFDCRGAGKP
jgi:Tfp pilus assembly protein FimT